jgi:small subunit ribosomal protein S19
MPRSVKKGPFIRASLMKHVQRALETNSNKPIKTPYGDSMILPMMVNMTIMVYNGMKYISVFITEEMVGHRLGEFVPRRTFKGHSGDRKTK